MCKSAMFASQHDNRAGNNAGIAGNGFQCHVLIRLMRNVVILGESRAKGDAFLQALGGAAAAGGIPGMMPQ